MRLVHCARIFLCLLALVTAASGYAGAGTLYGSAFTGPDGLADLYTIDPSTGAPTLVGPIKFQRVGAMDFGPDGRLYAVGERNDGTDTVVLIVIDTATGLGTEVAPLAGLAPNRPVTDISFRPSDGLLYVFLDIPDQVGTIDHASGAVTFLGFPGTFGGGNALSFTQNLTLHHVEYGATLFTVNQVSGLDTLVGALGFPGFPPLSFPKLNAMDAEPSTGRLFAAVNDGSGGGGPHYLGSLDPLTLSVSFIGSTVNGLDALAWQPDHCRVALYGASHSGPGTPSRFLRIDPITGAAVSIGAINFNSVGGIDVHPQTGQIFGIGNRPSDGTPVLITIDPATGAGTEVGPLVNAGFPGGGGLFDLSFRSDGRLFLSGWTGGPNSFLYSVNQATGFATPLGGMGTLGGGNGIAFSLADILYHNNNAGGVSQLYTLNQSTGLASLQSLLAYSGFPALLNPRLNAMDTDPSTGYAWGAVNDGAGTNFLATVDPRRGLVRNIGVSAAGLDAITWAPLCDDGDPCTVDECVRCKDDTLYGAAFTGPDGLASLMKIDPTSGTAAVIGPIGFQRVSAMDYDRETGVLYGTGERNDATNTNVLIAIDPATGAGNEVGVTGLPFGLSLDVESDISIRNSDGAIYAYIEANDGVATIDRLTGAATFLGFSGIGGLGNGVEFNDADVLFHANDFTVNTIDQTTGAAAVGPVLAWAGFPPPIGVYRIAAIDGNCNGRFFVVVKDGNGGGPAYLGVLDTASGTVTHIGATNSRMDALAWTSQRGFCANTFVDSDLDTVCDAEDCAALDPSAWIIPPEIATDTMANAFDYVWGSLAAISGPGTVYDLAADTVGALPVGPMEPPFFFLCSVPHVPISVGDPPLGQIWWVVVRGRNVCGVGTYGYEQHNDLPPFPLFVQRNTANCP